MRRRLPNPWFGLFTDAATENTVCAANFRRANALDFGDQLGYAKENLLNTYARGNPANRKGTRQACAAFQQSRDLQKPECALCHLHESGYERKTSPMRKVGRFAAMRELN